MTTKKKTRITAEKGSGNVFADLGLPHPEREQLRAHLTLQIYRIIKKRDLTQAAAGEILGIKHPKIREKVRAYRNANTEKVMTTKIDLIPF